MVGRLIHGVLIAPTADAGYRRRDGQKDATPAAPRHQDRQHDDGHRAIAPRREVEPAGGNLAVFIRK
ncbi:hypothetical protein [Acrocarpospora pleiomorpha]|uniref:hypothetical protein n=1 Tax=Acrocarpospora pleiomorpha TaxID=90975 RepID=UPI0012D3539B|nr:hypothetical protein [Acrocarpospora pleiomorpha]